LRILIVAKLEQFRTRQFATCELWSLELLSPLLGEPFATFKKKARVHFSFPETFLTLLELPFWRQNDATLKSSKMVLFLFVSRFFRYYFRGGLAPPKVVPKSTFPTFFRSDCSTLLQSLRFEGVKGAVLAPSQVGNPVSKRRDYAAFTRGFPSCVALLHYRAE
jgi:hypothetical protein